MFDTWRYGKWRYIGYSDLVYKSGTKKDQYADTIHFYVRDKNEKIRRIDYSGHSIKNEAHEFYNQMIVPWLEGGDMWKPVCHPIATKGTIINYVGNQPKP
jgi:hypothetical protein